MKIIKKKQKKEKLVKNKKGIKTQRLDGDVFRNFFGDKLRFNKEDRDFNF